jgi:hypothetical protein
MEKYFQHLPDGYLLAASNSGYTNEELAIGLAKHIIKYTGNYQKGNYRMLLFDGHDSHVTKDFLEILEDAHIIPLLLPPHTTHFLQPLDVGVFQPYKYWHTQAVDRATRIIGGEFTKTEFLHYLHSIRKRALKPTNIISGWR